MYRLIPKDNLWAQSVGMEFAESSPIEDYKSVGKSFLFT